MSFASDLAALNAGCLSDFGEPITYTPAGGGPVAITGIWDTRDEDGAREYHGRLWALISAFPSYPKKLDVITVAGVDYSIRNEPSEDEDGGGGVWLKVRKK